MVRTGIVLALLVAVAGCASTGQVKKLETRMAELEAADRQRAADDAAARVELEGKLMDLRLELERQSAAQTAAADDVKAQLEAAQRQARAAAVPSRPSYPQPDPAAVYAVPVVGAPALGPDDALVTIVRAGEYACPYCEKVRATLDELRGIYGPKLRVVYRSYVVHPQLATIPAQAACAANHQRRFWDLDHVLWEKAFTSRNFEASYVESLAAELGLDLERYRRDLAGPCVAEVKADMAMLERFGVRATPAFFINGRFLSGAQPTAAFQAVIDEELAKAEARVKASKKKKGNYYEQWVMAKGLTGLAAVPTPAIAAPTGGGGAPGDEP